MGTVMDRRNRLAGFVILVVVSAFLLGGGVFVGTAHAKPAAEEANCLIHSLPSFIDQGEFTAEEGSVADLVEVECKSVFAGAKVGIAARELANRCPLFWIYGHSPVNVTEASTLKGIKLDGAGNVEVALVAGPSCASGEVLISAHMEEAPYQTVTTPYTILGPKETKPGLEVKGATNEPKQVEDYNDSSLFAIVQVEYPSVYAEKDVEVSAEQLFSRCAMAPKLVWFTEDAKHHKVEAVASVKLKLDDLGNAFAIVDAEESCAPKGESEFESVLLVAPGTRETAQFEVEGPHETF